MLTRRAFLERSGKAAVTLALLKPATLLAGGDRRFFLHVFVKGGADATYLFDARDESFTRHGHLQNYRTDRAVHLWEDGKGGRTWVSSLAQSLAPERQRFTLLNGVHMARGFDGHPQNVALMITGNASGGPLFVTDFPRPADVPLSFLAQGRFEGHETPSMESGVGLKPNVARKLAERFRGVREPGAGDQSFEFVEGRANAIADMGGGALATGGAQLSVGLGGAGAIIAKQKAVRLCAAGGTTPCDPRWLVESTETSAMSDGLKAAGEYFAQGLAQSALLSVSYEIDTHDKEQAKAQEKAYAKVVDDLRAVLRFLDQPYDEARGLSFGDVTTVLVSSEFSRTMRQEGQAVDETGTDHNPFTNTVLLAGHGVTKGLILGATDFDTLDAQGALGAVSGAHQLIDPEKLRPVGKPFDHAALKVTDELPAAYDDGKYLTFLNVINTLYESFGVDASKHKAYTRTGPKAAVLAGLLRR